jgi:hypothetical protein
MRIMLECHFYKQGGISTRIVILTCTNVITTLTHKSDSYTQSVILTRTSVIYTRIVILTRTNQITTLTAVLSTRTRVIPTRKV